MTRPVYGDEPELIEGEKATSSELKNSVRFTEDVGSRNGYINVRSNLSASKSKRSEDEAPQQVTFVQPPLATRSHRVQQAASPARSVEPVNKSVASIKSGKSSRGRKNNFMR